MFDGELSQWNPLPQSQVVDSDAHNKHCPFAGCLERRSLDKVGTVRATDRVIGDDHASTERAFHSATRPTSNHAR